MMRRQQTKISLFAFQDIIMAVTGVIILCTLLESIYTMYFASAANAFSEESKISVSPDQLQAMIRQLQQENAKLEKQLQQLQSQVDAHERASRGYLEELRTTLEEKQRTLEQLQRQWQALPQTEKELAAAEHKLQQLQDTLDQMREKADSLRHSEQGIQAGREIYYRFRPIAGKRWWVVDLAKERLLAVELDEQGRPTGKQQTFQGTLLSSPKAAFLRWLRNIRPRKHAFLLLVRPSAAELFDDIRDALRKRGFAIGYELIAEDAEVRLVSSGQ